MSIYTGSWDDGFKPQSAPHVGIVKALLPHLYVLNICLCSDAPSKVDLSISGSTSDYDHYYPSVARTQTGQ